MDLRGDGMHTANALRNEVMPTLDRLAADPLLRARDLRLFDREKPPPYESSTKEEDSIPPQMLGTGNSEIEAKIPKILDEPLNASERQLVSASTRRYDPGARYEEEWKSEYARIIEWARYEASPATREYFMVRAGVKRANVLARRNIKRRWQKLGVWNSDWGIPHQVDIEQETEFSGRWNWPWQDPDTVNKYDPQHPLARAVELRQGLRRGQHVPVMPQSRLRPDTSASQAESFITSRPWMIYALDVRTEFVLTSRTYATGLNMDRLDIEQLWKDRGDWKPEWNKQDANTTLVGWKWRHESPSPEPEDLSAFNDLATLELTPSEADALEAIPPPSPPTPQPPWREQDPSDIPPNTLFEMYIPPPFSPAARDRAESDDNDEDIPTHFLPPSLASLFSPPVRRSTRIAATKAASSPPPPPPRQRQQMHTPRAAAAAVAAAAAPPFVAPGRPNQGRRGKKAGYAGVSKPPAHRRRRT